MAREASFPFHCPLSKEYAEKILIVDDEPDILEIVSFRLKKAGYKVLTAEDGQEALDIVRSKKPDLILLDLTLPGIDGYEVCRILKADKIFKSIPIIFLTASQVIKVEERSKGAEADDYILKPFEPEELLEKVKRFTK